MNMMFKNKFVFPYNEEITNYFEFIEKYKFYINEIYISPLVEPFMVDMNAGIIQPKTIEYYKELIRKILSYNIKVNLVFNNVFVEPSDDNLKKFKLSIDKLLIDDNIIVTIPSYEFKKVLPSNIKIKNTVINFIKTKEQVKKYKDFDYIYLDDIFLKKLDEVKELIDIYGDRFIIISNHTECISSCEYKHKHYKNLTTSKTQEQVDNACDSICPLKKSDWKQINSVLTEAYIFPTLKEYELYAKYFKYLKVRGRHNINHCKAGMEIIKNIDKSNNILNILDYKKFMLYGGNIKKFNEWLETIHNCGGEKCFLECFKCQEFIK